jgi:hypothetical protein
MGNNNNSIMKIHVEESEHYSQGDMSSSLENNNGSMKIVYHEICDVCAVCLNDLEEDNTFTTSCNHTFCKTCPKYLHELYGNYIKCPLCRHTFAYDTYGYKSTPQKLEFDMKNYPNNFEMNFIEDISERNMLTSAYKTITRLEKWEYLNKYVVNEYSGFINTNDVILILIMRHISKDYNDNHTGFTMGYTMRFMHFIARFGTEELRRYITGGNG